MPLPSTTLDDYVVLEVIGEGSFGRVYRGRRRFTAEIVALKMLPRTGRTAKEVALLQREIEIMQSLSHPNIITLLDSFETPNDVVVVTDYAEGEIFQVLEDDKFFPPRLVQSVAVQLVAALKYLHANRILHRDLKPQNILIGKEGRILLCDFGFALMNFEDSLSLALTLGRASAVASDCGAMAVAVHAAAVSYGWRAEGGNGESVAMLPASFAANDGRTFTLEYRRDPGGEQATVLVVCVARDANVVVSVCRNNDNRTVSVDLKPVVNFVNAAAFATDSDSSCEPDYTSTYTLRVRTLPDLLKSVLGCNKSDRSHPTTTTTTTPSPAQPRPSAPMAEPDVDPLRIGRPMYPGGVNPFNVGGADLDPLGGGPLHGGPGGGMLVGPNHPMFAGGGGGGGVGGLGMPGRGGPHMPPGVPPGARFDPYGPPMGGGPRGGRPGRGGRGGIGGDPDPDHFQPPDYGNMFM